LPQQKWDNKDWWQGLESVDNVDAT
jgi:hypothetical protein